jgi:glycosyltransferase involved in cell wall biosynthesis
MGNAGEREVVWSWTMPKIITPKITTLKIGTPKVSVCIPTYNRAHFLSGAIASVMAQTVSDWEIVVCDDGSTDGTPELMASYSDARIRYVRHDRNIGKSNNMRSGFEAATGEYFVKFDDDDRLTPDFLAKTSQILDQTPGVDLVGTDHWVIDAVGDRNVEWTDTNSRKWGRSDLREGVIQDLLSKVFVTQCLQVGATLWRMDSLHQLDYMRRDWQSCEDNDLFVRFAQAGMQGYYWPERLMEYRFHAEQQRIESAIAHLRAKVVYLESHQFADESIEAIRHSRLIETQLLLGLRLVEYGETESGRSMLQAGRSHAPKKAIAGLMLSHVPKPFRKSAFGMVRSLMSN